MDNSHVFEALQPKCVDCGVNIQMDKQGRTKYCRPCANKRNNKRKKYSERTPFEKLKHNTRRESRGNVKSGFVKKQPCDVCGDPKSEIHHDDYSDAWKFRWMCKKCHVNYHKMLKLIPSLDTTKQMKTA